MINDSYLHNIYSCLRKANVSLYFSLLLLLNIYICKGKKTIRSKLGNGLFSIKEKKNQSNSLIDMNKTISYILNHVISVVFLSHDKKKCILH